MLISEETRVILSFAQIGLLIAIIWTFAKVYFSNKADNEKKDIEIQNLNIKVLNQDDKIEKLEDKHNLIEVTQAVLNTKLENIEVGVVDIKAMLTRHIEIK
jgi:hypothetical protein